MTASVDSQVRPASEWQVAVGGVMVIAVSYGFARYGYGLFLPRIRDEFGLSTSTLGLIGSATYIGYLVALTLVGVLAGRVGPRPLIIGAGLSAAAGMTLVAIAPSPGLLVAGLVLAGTSSGWAWAPYSDVVDRLVRPQRQQQVMALLPAGTAFGVAAAGPLALISHDTAWRYVWLLFGVVALIATVYNAGILPSGATRSTVVAARSGIAFRRLLRRQAAPLYLTALSYGLIGAVYWTFAVDAITGAGAAGPAVGPLFWTLIGLAGTAGVFTGTLLARIGLRGAHGVLFAAIAGAVVLLGLAPGAPAFVAVSAVLYGPTFMAVSGLLAVWSHRLFPERPSAGLSAAVFFLGIGTVIGPAALGFVADRYDLRTAFVLTAAIAAATVWVRPGQPSSRSKNATVRRIDSGQSS